jgi:hypothetical protein
MSTEAFFILPNGDAVTTLYIGGSDGKPTHGVTAESVLKMQSDVEHYRKVLMAQERALSAEQDKIRRLMKALADEVVG